MIESHSASHTSTAQAPIRRRIQRSVAVAFSVIVTTVHLLSACTTADDTPATPTTTGSNDPEQALTTDQRTALDQAGLSQPERACTAERLEDDPSSSVNEATEACQRDEFIDKAFLEVADERTGGLTAEQRVCLKKRIEALTQEQLDAIFTSAIAVNPTGTDIMEDMYRHCGLPADR
jgi:hypothetical protein